MKMPDVIEDLMLAPCGMNCAVCYKHVGARGKHCEGCLKGDVGKPEHCRSCAIQSCAQSRGYTYCFECEAFPCKRMRNLEQSYRKRYQTSLIENSQMAKTQGVTAFLALDREKWTCPDCGGAFSLHDNACSACGRVGRGEDKHGHATQTKDI